MANAISPKVGVSAFAGAVVAFALYLAKARAGLDLSGQEANLIVIVMAVVGWIVPDSNGAPDATPKA